MNYFFLLLVIIFAPLHMQGHENLEISEDAHIRFELPINWSSSPKYNLDVSIPSGYHALQSFSEWFDKELDLIEFVPNGQNSENWSEIISLNKFISKKISADIFVAKLRSALLTKLENGKIWKEETTQYPNYKKATFFFSYDYEDQHEILGAIYYSGPFDCVGIQYTIRSDNDKEAFSKIENFFETMTHVSAQ